MSHAPKLLLKLFSFVIFIISLSPLLGMQKVVFKKAPARAANRETVFMSDAGGILSLTHLTKNEKEIYIVGHEPLTQSSQGPLSAGDEIAKEVVFLLLEILSNSPEPTAMPCFNPITAQREELVKYLVQRSHPQFHCHLDMALAVLAVMSQNRFRRIHFESHDDPLLANLQLVNCTSYFTPDTFFGLARAYGLPRPDLSGLESDLAKNPGLRKELFSKNGAFDRFAEAILKDLREINDELGRNGILSFNEYFELLNRLIEKATGMQYAHSGLVEKTAAVINSLKNAQKNVPVYMNLYNKANNNNSMIELLFEVIRTKKMFSPALDEFRETVLIPILDYAELHGFSGI